MHGIGFNLSTKDWFDFKTPKATIPPNYIETCIQNKNQFYTKPSAQIIWLGTMPEIEKFIKNKKGNSWPMIRMHFHSLSTSLELVFEESRGIWLIELLTKAMLITNNKKIKYSDIKGDFEHKMENFDLFWYSKQIENLKKIGLLAI
jgi:hypothetical protein